MSRKAVSMAHSRSKYGRALSSAGSSARKVTGGTPGHRPAGRRSCRWTGREGFAWGPAHAAGAPLAGAASAPMTSRRSRRAAHGDALASAVGGVVCLAIAVGVLAGAPGAGVYVGLLAAWGLAAAVARGPYGTAGMSRAMQLLA